MSRWGTHGRKSLPTKKHMNTKSSMTRSRSNSEVHCCCCTGGDDCEDDADDDDDGDDASTGGTILMMGALASGDDCEDDDDGDDVNIDVDSGGSCDEEVSLVMSWFSFRKCCFNICRSVDTSRHSKSSLLYVIESTYIHGLLSIYLFIYLSIYQSITSYLFAVRHRVYIHACIHGS